MNSKCIILFSWLVLLFAACNNNQQPSKQQFTIYPEDTIMIQFDIKTFNENNTDTISNYPSYEYLTEDGITIELMKLKDEGYQERRTYPDSIFYDLYIYYPNGNLCWKSKYFKYGRFAVGREINYDESGNIINVEDTDAPYKFTLDEVLKFIEHENIDIRKGKVSISRGIVGDVDTVYNEALRSLPVDTYFWGVNISLPEQKYREMILNADNGKVTYDKIPADDYTDE